MKKRAASNDNQGRCNLRVAANTLASIDAARARRAGFLSRNSWIAEAIKEKLQREGVEPAPEHRSALNA
jgi:hypothetical protein